MSNPVKYVSSWTWLLLAVNGIAVTGLGMLLWRHEPSPKLSQSSAKILPSNAASWYTAPTTPKPSPSLQRQDHLNYQEWLKVLEKEANAIAEKSPSQLSVLAGDSITLGFPQQWLPAGSTWLNQSVSGDTSAGLLKRLDLFGQTHPDRIFIMIGINDLLRGFENEMVLSNYREILDTLQREHPQAKIVVQSILPHATSETASWEGRDRLKNVTNARIRYLNTRLQAIAEEETGVYYLNLYPLFADEERKLDPKLSTDGLHLNERGYLVWRSAIQMYTQLVLAQDSSSTKY